MGRILISLMDQIGGTKTTMEVPDDVLVELLIQSLVEALDYPIKQVNNLIAYKLDNIVTGETLNEKLTLAGNGIESGAIISISPIILAKQLKTTSVKTNVILFLASNPLDTERLRLDQEVRAVDYALRQTLFRDRFDIKQHWAVRESEIQDILLRHNPDIIHFSGHGSRASEIILEDDFGKSHPVPSDALSELFSVLKGNIRCVVFNACYSEQQAQGVAQYIDCVVGMSRAIGDLSAISFSVAFYRALGYGKDVETAFKLGCMQIHLADLKDQDTPKLLSIKSNPSEIVFVK